VLILELCSRSTKEYLPYLDHMESASQERLAALCLLLTLIHTFSAGRLGNLSKRWTNRHPRLAQGLHLLSEVEFIFGFWALTFLALRIPFTSLESTGSLLRSLHFSESVFVAVAMILASTRPVLEAARVVIEGFAGSLPLPLPLKESRIPLLFSILFLAPLSGSLITEPAAMTVGALLIQKRIFGNAPSRRLLYSVLGTLLVNVSIGGVLTAFAAPPVLVVARIWEWDTLFMMQHFGWKALCAVLLNAALTCWINRGELLNWAGIDSDKKKRTNLTNPILFFINSAFLIFFVMALTSPVGLAWGIGLFLPYLWLTREEQGEFNPGQGLLVGFFLAGLMVLTAEQDWWLSPLLQSLNGGTLFVGASLLTAITDNAALTSLAAQVEGLSTSSRYLVVAGAVTGGGLTLIANAPNPAGFAIFKHRFQKEGFHPLTLIQYALIPTLIAGGLFWIH
jgi:hypothetical protein